MRASSPVVRGFGRVAALLAASLVLACSGAEPTSAGPAAGPSSPVSTTPPVTPAAPPVAAPPPADGSGDAAPPDAAGPLPPVDRSCEVDDDCVLSALEIKGETCCIGCLTAVTNKRWKEQAQAYCATRYDRSCPKKRCGSGPPPKCRAGQCN